MRVIDVLITAPAAMAKVSARWGDAIRRCFENFHQFSFRELFFLPDDSGDGGFELFELDRLDQMFGKSALHAFRDISVHPEATDRNAANRIFGAKNPE